MKLRKSLRLLDVFGLSAGAMLSGLFILPGLAFARAGPAMLMAYLLAALLALTGLASQAELASAMPKAGGTYFYVTRSMGSATGAVYGLITWLSMALKSAYELVFVGTFLAGVLGGDPQLIAIGWCALFLLLNYVGVREAGRVQAALVLALLALLAYFCARSHTSIKVANFSPFLAYGWGSVFRTAGFVFISFGGLLKVASIAEEVQQPGRAVPLGMLLSLVAVSGIYLASMFAAVGVLGPELAGATSPMTQAAGVFLGNTGRIALGLASVLAIISSANAGIMAASRYPFALARDGMLPPLFAAMSARFRTPHASLLVTGAMIVLLLYVKLDLLVRAASSVLILTYVFTCLAVIVLRESRVQNYQPSFRSPLYPWLQVAGILGFAALLYEIGLTGLVTTASLALAGFAIYWFYGRRGERREYALLHLIARITARELTSRSLETELKEIIHERDDVLKDRFDHLIERCPVLDLEGPVHAEELFRRAAPLLARDLQVPEERVFAMLVERERESSTVLNSFLAVPHIIVEGEHHFDVLLARCREGIEFSPDSPPVRVVFMLIGSRDERRFHLMSLAAIAQLIQEPGFEKRWMAARDPEALRDVVLLGKRRRQE